MSEHTDHRCRRLHAARSAAGPAASRLLAKAETAAKNGALLAIAADIDPAGPTSMIAATG